MLMSVAIQKALTIAQKTGQVMYVVYDPDSDMDAQHSYYPASAEDLDTHYMSARPDDIVFCTDD